MTGREHQLLGELGRLQVATTEQLARLVFGETRAETATRLARRHLQWLTHRGLAENVDFAGALGTTQGVDDTLSGLGRMFAMTEHVEVIKRWIDGPDVLTWFELRTATAGPMAIVNWSHVEAGRITRIRVSFDPRPMLG
ncbi:MAG TPA: hypothetical protein VGJ54_04850 [Streptosporangiaceae bacterium]